MAYRAWEKILADEGMRALAGAAAYARGREYAAGGRVSALVVTPALISASVRGGAVYAVRLWRRGRHWQYTCECAAACEGAFCKHCVATGLVVAGNRQGAESAGKKIAGK
ncbi:MAG: SWIM zinc finger domain-containing protein [Blastocatellia bacterium]